MDLPAEFFPQIVRDAAALLPRAALGLPTSQRVL